MRKSILVLALILFTLVASAQVRKCWVKTWGGTDNYGLGRGVAIDSSGNVYVAGQTSINGYFMGVIVKYGPGGQQLWETTFGTAPRRMVVDRPGNVYLTGTYYSGSFAYLVAKKCNSDGQVEWTQTHAQPGGAGGSGIAVDRFGNVYASGWGKIDTPKVRYMIVVVKYSAQGEKLWALADTVETYIENVALAVDDNGVYVCVPVRGVTYLASYGLDGIRRWFKRHGKFGAYSPGYYGDIALDRDGNVYFTSSTARDSMAQVDLLAGAYTSDGGLLWEDTWICSADGMSAGGAIAVDDSTRSIFVTGLYYPDRTVNVKRAVTMKHTSLGSRSWTRTYEGAGDWDCFYGIAADHHGNAYVAGFTDIGPAIAGSKNILMKYGPAGEVKWSESHMITGGDDVWVGVVVDSSEKIYVGGSITTTWSPYTIVLSCIKYTQGRLFQPDPDGWIFSNSKADMWPEAWHSQFDYSRPPYPWFLTTWPYNAKSSDFPDWPLFVEAFGHDQCYFSSATPGAYIMKPSALLRWRSIAGPWHGSCFGFAVSSLLVFNDYLSLEEMFPESQSVLSVPLSDKARSVVNRYQIYQYGKTYQVMRNLLKPTPTETARELVKMLSIDSLNRRELSMYNTNGVGGHTVVPCRIGTGNSVSGVVQVGIYDSNYPGKEQVLWIDTVMNTWSYPNMPGWGGSKWLELESDVTTYASKPDLAMIGSRVARAEPADSPDSTGYTLYVTPGAGCIVTDGEGGAVGYNPVDSALTTTLAGAHPIIPMTGTFSPPIGYYLPSKPYDIQVSAFPDTSLYVRAIEDSLVVGYEEHGARSGEKMFFRMSGAGDFLAARNPETRARTGMLRSVRVSPDRELACDIADMTIPGNDSLAIAMTEGSSVRLQAGGSASTYTLSLALAAPCTSMQFRHRGVALSGSSTHIIAPDWERLNSVPVNVFVDIDGDGAPDDTLTLANEITDVSDPRGAIDVPGHFRLEQNYPNPFNSTTTIRYGLPVRSHVTLTVFNALGQQVATLVQGEQDLGYHEVKFDGSALASGVYVYTLQAGSFVQSRKLLLLR